MDSGLALCAPRNDLCPKMKRRMRARRDAHARAHFFEKDALLYAKHPERYRRLFEAEGHWKKTPGFWEHFRRGGEKYGVDLAEFEERLAESLPPETVSG